jgi:hypothetical protein
VGVEKGGVGKRSFDASGLRGFEFSLSRLLSRRQRWFVPLAEEANQSLDVLGSCCEEELFADKLLSA